MSTDVPERRSGQGSLAVFVGQTFYHDSSGFSTGEAFIKFIEAFSEIYGRVTLLVRVQSEQARGCYPIDEARLRVVTLPYFDQLDPLGLLGVRAEMTRTLAQELPNHGAVWVGGPHLVGRRIVALCQSLRVPCFLLIRQNLIEQVRHKTRGLRKPIALLVTRWLEGHFRRLALRHPTFTVGRKMYDAYGGGRSGNVHELFINLLRDVDIPRDLPVRVAGRPFRLLWVGRLSPEKGLAILLEALAGLPPTCPTLLTLVGEGDIRAQLEERVLRLGLREQVRFAGYVPFGKALDAYYQAADLLVLPSLTGEGLPQVVLEAMAAGVPCLASAVEGIPYLIRDGKNGRLVPPGDPVALRQALIDCIQDEQLRASMARAGLETVRHHSLEAERQRIVDVLASQFGFLPLDQGLPADVSQRGAG